MREGLVTMRDTAMALEPGDQLASKTCSTAGMVSRAVQRRGSPPVADTGRAGSFGKRTFEASLDRSTRGLTAEVHANAEIATIAMRKSRFSLPTSSERQATRV